jgi:hypothetical protein
MPAFLVFLPRPGPTLGPVADRQAVRGGLDIAVTDKP